MPAMKLTPAAAMRARDVSRPRAEHLAEAERAEAARAASGAAPASGGDGARKPVPGEGRRPARNRKVSRR